MEEANRGVRKDSLLQRSHSILCCASMLNVLSLPLEMHYLTLPVDGVRHFLTIYPTSGADAVDSYYRGTNGQPSVV